MTDDNLPTAIWSGSFTLFGVEINCHTLSDGQRIIEADSVADLLEAMSKPCDPHDAGDIADFAKWKSET